ncbi:transglutaminaseTgpA domain-containing protein [Pseudolysinimonas sp.]|uniref:transglutaminase family protein n=1 Tax=Pseudolysinimonas sp. TaxID=2680009 RepID=UPI0037830986
MAADLVTRRAAANRTSLRLVLFTVALLVAFGGLAPLLEGENWFAPAALPVILPVLAIGIAARIGRRPWQPFVAGLVAGVATLTFGYARDVALLGVIPTVETVGRWGELVGQGAAAISTQRTPATATDGILFLLAILAVVAVVFIAPVLDRLPATAALPLLVVLDIPVAVRGGLAEPVWFVLAAVAFLALLRVGRRPMPLPGVLATAAVVIVGSLVLPAVFPEPPDAPTASGNGIGTGLNPLVDLGDDLRRDEIVPALTYSSDAPGGLYLRLATLDEFTGITWTPDTDTDPANDVADFPPPQGLDDAVPRAAYTADIQIADVGGRWLPVPYPATAVTGVEGAWRWEPDGLSVRSGGADARGQDYSVSFLDIQPDLAQLNADAPVEDLERYLELPDLPTSIQQVADTVAGSGTTYERAIALQSYFADGDFEYSIDTPVEQDYDGTGIGVIEQFLETKSGYCVHFASSMAVMARAVGIPSRMVVGFQPGVRNSLGDRNEFLVDSSDLHAWPELFFEGIGWLRFEPTPGRGAAPSYSTAAGVDDPATPENEAENPEAAPVTPAPAAPTTAPEEETVDDSPVVAAAQSPVPVVLLVALGGILLLLVPAIWRVVVRSRRMRLVLAGDAAAAWAEVRDTAHDHDWVAPDSETPRQLGARLAVVVGDAAVRSVRHGVEAAAYDRPGARAMTPEDVDALRRAIASAAPLRVRLRAIFLPPSLTARVGLTRRDDLGG